MNRILAHAMLVGREITIESAAELLADLLRASSRQIAALTQFRNALQRIMMFGFQRCFQRAGLAILLAASGGHVSGKKPDFIILSGYWQTVWWA